jgi:hypothetical protein
MSVILCAREWMCLCERVYIYYRSSAFVRCVCVCVCVSVSACDFERVSASLSVNVCVCL